MCNSPRHGHPPQSTLHRHQMSQQEVGGWATHSLAPCWNMLTQPGLRNSCLLSHLGVGILEQRLDKVAPIAAKDFETV